MSTTRGGNSLFYPSFWANDSVGNGYIRIRKKGDDTLTERTRKHVDNNDTEYRQRPVWDLGERSVASCVWVSGLERNTIKY